MTVTLSGSRISLHGGGGPRRPDAPAQMSLAQAWTRVSVELRRVRASAPQTTLANQTLRAWVGDGNAREYASTQALAAALLPAVVPAPVPPRAAPPPDYSGFFKALLEAPIAPLPPRRMLSDILGPARRPDIAAALPHGARPPIVAPARAEDARPAPLMFNAQARPLLWAESRRMRDIAPFHQALELLTVAVRAVPSTHRWTEELARNNVSVVFAVYEDDLSPDLIGGLTAIQIEQHHNWKNALGARSFPDAATAVVGGRRAHPVAARFVIALNADLAILDTSVPKIAMILAHELTIHAMPLTPLLWTMVTRPYDWQLRHQAALMPHGHFHSSGQHRAMFDNSEFRDVARAMARAITTADGAAIPFEALYDEDLAINRRRLDAAAAAASK